jgi:hypothetical protein
LLVNAEAATVALVLKDKVKVKVVSREAAGKAAIQARVKVVAKAALLAVSKEAARGKVLVTGPKAAAHKAVAAALVVGPAAAVVPTRHRQTFLTDVTMTSSLGNCAKRPRKRKILSCARNSGRSTAITRRARADDETIECSAATHLRSR